MPRDLIGVRFTMWATVVPRLATPAGDGNDNHTASEKGQYVTRQDPDSFQIITVWEPDTSPTASTPAARFDTQCYARGYTNLGFRSSGNRESYLKGQYEEIEAIQFDYPSNVALTRQSYITDIRSHQDDTDYIWLDPATGLPMLWEVQGITPVVDPFGKMLRFTTVLKRAQFQ